MSELKCKGGVDCPFLSQVDHVSCDAKPITHFYCPSREPLEQPPEDLLAKEIRKHVANLG